MSVWASPHVEVVSTASPHSGEMPRWVTGNPGNPEPLGRPKRKVPDPLARKERKQPFKLFKDRTSCSTWAKNRAARDRMVGGVLKLI